MNLLYITKLSGNPNAGLTYSIPAQMSAQSLVDNVFWLDLDTREKENLAVAESVKKINDINHLPKIDLAVIEGFFEYPFSITILKIIWMKIPYVVIPRGSITKDALQHKKIKKKVCNFLWFRNIVAKSVAIEYLSENERDNSDCIWKKKNVIIPNGINVPEYDERQFFPNGSINAVFIGRLDVKQKGLDLLLQSIYDSRDLLRQNHFVLNVYGPSWDNSAEYLKKKISEKQINDLIFINQPVFGEDKELILRKSDVFILTSRYEGMPMGVLEALAFGVPCLVTSGTNLKKQVEQYDAGWGCETDAASISFALKRMIAEKDFFVKKSQKANALANVFSWRSIAEKTSQIYSELIK